MSRLRARRARTGARTTRKPDMVIAPNALRDRGKRYLNAGKCLMDNDPLRSSFTPAVHDVLARSIELSLKAFLSAKGIGRGRMKSRALGHDLEELYIEAMTHGLDRIVKLTPEEMASIGTASAGLNEG